MSPTLNTFANGSHAGMAKMSVSGRSAGSGDARAVRVAVVGRLAERPPAPTDAAGM